MRPMHDAHIVVLIGSLLAAACLWASLRLRRRQRLLHDLPTSKTLGVFIGMVELKGSAESEEPLSSHLAECPCVIYSWKVEEHWSRTVTSTDSKGRTTTRRESGWKTVDEGGQSIPFYLRDEEGVVLIRPEGASYELLTVFDQTVNDNEPLYYAKGPRHAVSHSDYRRRFTEQAIRLHAPVYIVGPARERDDIVAPEIAAQDDAPLYLISVRSEERVQSSLAGWSWFWWALGLIIAAVPLIILFVSEARDWQTSPENGGLLLTGYLVVWSATWVWMVYNSLVGLRERVRQGASLIDVQLKRRHDLLPALTATIGGLGSHERTVQETLASLRAQTTATPRGAAGPDFAGVAAQLRVVIENYPALTAQTGFSALHDQLVETEQRIALARAYYNDIATQFATRLEIVPDRWVASLGSMKPEPLLAAAHFERAAVNVNFTDTNRI
ncbi:LemA family protein [Rariglobus hedericola]|nr:LemA family protein [Rariglobus hedericola]